MKIKNLFCSQALSIVFVFSFLLGLNVSAKEGSENKPTLNEFLDKEFDSFLERSPEGLTHFGSRKKYEKLDATTFQDYKINLDLIKVSLANLKKFDRKKLMPDEQISFDLYEQSSLDDLKSEKFYYHRYFVNHLFGRHTDLVDFMINQHLVANSAEAWSYISRLNEFDRALQELIIKIKTQNEKGIKYPNFVFDQVIRDCKNILKGFPFQNVKKDSDLYKDFRTKVARISDDANTKNILMNKAKSALVEKVKPGYLNLISVLEDLKKIHTENNGVWALPDGEEYYKSRLKEYTSMDVKPQTIYKMGLSEVERIQNEMKELLVKLEFQGTLTDFFNEIKKNPKLFYPNTAQGKQLYLKDTKNIIAGITERLPEIFLKIPKAKLVVRPVESYREQSAPVAFYDSPAPDGSRPAVYYVNMYDMSTIAKYDMEALAYHEALPGHHMQIAMAQELEALPKFRKYYSSGAYSEGWALYSERLPKDLGFYKDPYSEFGRLSMELWRAARLVVDPGIHYYKWSKEKAIAYMNENTPHSLDKNTKEVERYFVLPGQAVSYKMGQLKILELRQKSEKALGEKFDLKAFHDVILKNGPLSFPLLEKVVAQYIKDELAQNKTK